MKNRYKLSFKWLVGIATCSGVLLTSCNDYLDITPPSDIPPELYLNEENELATYVNGLYGILPSHGGIYTYGIFGGFPIYFESALLFTMLSVPASPPKMP